MATIIKKMKGGRPYFYLVESARVNGKPRIVRQVYLGKAEDIAARLAGAGPAQPSRVRVSEFGASVAAFALANEIGLAQIIDEVCPKRRRGGVGGRLYDAGRGEQGGRPVLQEPDGRVVQSKRDLLALQA